MRNKLDIAIAGAGPAGLAAALLLHRAGHRVCIFERFDRPAPVGSGLILQPTGLAVLCRLGLLEEILALGARIDRLHGADAATGRTVLDVRYEAGPGGRFGLAVHRGALFGVLHRAVLAAGIAIQTGQEAGEVRERGGGVVLASARGASLGRFDLVVDGTGARSRLRRFASRPCEPRALAYGALWASLRWPEKGFDPNALLQRYQRASVMVGVLPIGRPSAGSEPMAAFFWSLKPAQAEELQAAGLEAWKERVSSLWPECEVFLRQIESFEQFSLARYGHHTLSMPAGRRLAIIGDAAHSTSPQLGQGANMALLDAAALAHGLENSETVEEGLATYAAARRMHVRFFQALSSVFTPFYQSDSALLPLIRDRLVPVLAKVPPAPRLLAAMVSGTLLDPLGAIGVAEPDWSLPE